MLGAAPSSPLLGGAFSARAPAGRPVTAPVWLRGHLGGPPPSPRSCTSVHLASSATSRPRAAANSATFSAAGLALGACAPTAQNLLHTWTLAPERPKPSPTSPAPRGLTRLCLPCSAWGLAPVFHGARDILSGKAVILHLKPGRRPCRLSRGALSVERDLAAQPLGEGASRLVQD